MKKAPLHVSFFMFHSSLLTEFLHALLACDGLSGAFSGSGVRSGALASDGEAAAVPVAAVAADVAEARDVLLDLTAEGAFDGVVAVDERDDLRQLFFRKILGAALAVDAGFLEDLPAVGSADAEDVGEADPDGLIGGDVYA